MRYQQRYTGWQTFLEDGTSFQNTSTDILELTNFGKLLINNHISAPKKLSIWPVNQIINSSKLYTFVFEG